MTLLWLESIGYRLADFLVVQAITGAFDASVLLQSKAFAILYKHLVRFSGRFLFQDRLLLVFYVSVLKESQKIKGLLLNLLIKQKYLLRVVSLTQLLPHSLLEFNNNKNLENISFLVIFGVYDLLKTNWPMSTKKIK